MLLLSPSLRAEQPSVLPESVTAPSSEDERAQQPIWLAISKRDYSQAYQLYKAAKSDPQTAAKLESANFEPHFRGLSLFWRSVKAGLEKVSVGSQLELRHPPTASAATFKVIAKTEATITLENTETSEQTCYHTDVRQMPTALAVALFRFVHPEASASATAPFERYDAPETSDPCEIETTVTASPAADDDPRHPVPTAVAQRESRQNIRSLFSKAYAGRNPQAVHARATQLLKIGIETENAPVDQYVLFDEALEGAISIGDVDTALKTHSAMAERFSIDAGDHLTSISKSLISKTFNAAAATPLFQAYQAQISSLIAADQYADAKRIIDDIIPLAKKVRAASWIEYFDQESERVSNLNRKYASMIASLSGASVSQSPEDVTPNHAEVLGRFYCLEKGDWERGLPYLANAADKSLNQLATLELSPPTSDEQWLALAEGWAEYSESSPATQHARQIYQRLQGTTTGIQQAKIKQKLADIGKAEQRSIRNRLERYLDRPFAITWRTKEGDIMEHTVTFQRDGTYRRSWGTGAWSGKWHFDGHVIHGIVEAATQMHDKFQFAPGDTISGKLYLGSRLSAECVGNAK